MQVGDAAITQLKLASGRETSVVELPILPARITQSYPFVQDNILHATRRNKGAISPALRDTGAKGRGAWE